MLTAFRPSTVCLNLFSVPGGREQEECTESSFSSRCADVCGILLGHLPLGYVLQSSCHSGSPLGHPRRSSRAPAAVLKGTRCSRLGHPRQTFRAPAAVLKGIRCCPLGLLQQSSRAPQSLRVEPTVSLCRDGQCLHWRERAVPSTVNWETAHSAAL